MLKKRQRECVCVTSLAKQRTKTCEESKNKHTYGNVIRQQLYDLRVRHAFEWSCDDFFEVVLVALWNHKGKYSDHRATQHMNQ